MTKEEYKKKIVNIKNAYDERVLLNRNRIIVKIQEQSVEVRNRD